MGLFDVFKKKESQKVAEAIEVEAVANAVFAPIAGDAKALADVPDPVFASGALGEGLGIEPKEDSVYTVYAPVTGTISATTSTLHAIGLTSEDGIEVLIHVGIDTVEMQGAGFEGFVKDGQMVRAGQPLMTFDVAKIKAAGYNPTVILALTNSSDLASVTPVIDTELTSGDVAVNYSK